MPKQIKTTHLEEATAPKAVAVENAEPLNANPSEFPHEYEGVAYTAIVKNWLENKGIYGDVSEGARNTLLYALARDMRYICNFNAAYLMAVLPTWGLPATERQSAIQNAIGSPRGTEIPTTLQRAIEQARCNDNDNDDDNRGGIEDANPLPKRMPRLWRTICDMYPRQRKQAVLASLPALGTLLTNLRAIYPTGEEVNPIFFTIIQAPQASGKSFARELSNLLVKPIKALDAVAREELREYKRKKDAARNTKQQPEEPNVCIRLLPPTVSNAVLLKRMDNSDGKALYTFAEEIDTVNRSSSAGAWSAKSDIYRMAFDAAEWGQDYMSENSYSAIVNLRYNLLMLGTPVAVKKFFRSAEDGLVSRFIFAQLEDTAGENMEVKKPISRRTKEWMEGEVQRLHELGTKQPELSVLIPKTALAIYQWQERMIERYNRDPDQLALDRLRRRAGNYGFRVGMIAWALMGGRETPEVIEMATWAATEIFNGQYMVQGAALQEAEENNRALAEEQHRRLNSTKENLLDRLPQEFTLTDLIAERKKNGHTGESRYIISRFIKNKLITPIEGKKHTYKKL